MKHIYLPIIAILLIGFFNSCDKDFLKEPVKSYRLEQTIEIRKKQVPESIGLSIPPAKNFNFEVQMLPKWMKLRKMKGHFLNGVAQLEIESILPEFLMDNEINNASIVIYVEGWAQLQIPIQFKNLNPPSISLSAMSIDFKETNHFDLDILNTSDGEELSWEITQIPKWLAANILNGRVYPSNGQAVTLNVNRSGLEEGNYNGEIVFANNSLTPEVTINVSMQVVRKVNTSVAIEGEVIDAEFNKKNDKLYILTKNPNRFMEKEGANGKTYALELPHPPSCMNISEDGTKAIIGTQASQFIVIDLNTKSNKAIPIENTAFDVALDNDFAHFSLIHDDNPAQIRTLNLKTETISKTQEGRHNIYESTMLKKVPGKPLMVGSRKGISPSGILLFDIKNGICNNTVNYWHQSIYPFWFSEDGTKIFSGYSKVFNIPEFNENPPYHMDDLLTKGILSSNNSGEAVSALVHSTNNKRIYLCHEVYNSENSSTLEVYSDESYTLEEKLEIPPYYIVENGNSKVVPTLAKYLFISKDDSTIWLLKTTKDQWGNASNKWLLDEIRIK
ncbi:hypothetical protein EMN47_00145 [Prolixibacteraceae bacterium JC049]|nr:hypothetical protein [Prolixibacteraceae bacterium JC049]